MASANAAIKGTPKEAQVMAAILKDMGVNEYEPRVINQMMEFSYREYIIIIMEKTEAGLERPLYPRNRCRITNTCYTIL